MNRRQFAVTSGATLTTILAGCTALDGSSGGDDESGEDDGNGGDGESGNGENGTSGNGETDRSDPDAASNGVANDDDSPEPLAFSGSGDESTDEIELEEGLVALAATHNGDRRFVVTLVNEETGRERTLVRSPGQYNGAASETINGGSYQIDVEADGDWELVVSHPRGTDGRPLPTALEGDRDDVFGPFRFDGEHTAAVRFEGERNLIVRVHAPDGSFRSLLFNEIGAYDGDTSFEYTGVGYIAVRADGAWELELE